MVRRPVCFFVEFAYLCLIALIAVFGDPCTHAATNICATTFIFLGWEATKRMEYIEKMQFDWDKAMVFQTFHEKRFKNN